MNAVNLINQIIIIRIEACPIENSIRGEPKKQIASSGLILKEIKLGRIYYSGLLISTIYIIMALNCY
jgi:hypothetical protein